MFVAVRSWDDLRTWAAWQSWLYQEVLPGVSNHYSAGGLIAARIRDLCPLARQVEAIAHYGLIDQLLEHAPAVFVSPGPESPGNDDPRGRACVADQSWLVWVVARNIEKAEYGQAALDEAGAIVSQVIDALQGYKPSTRHGELRRYATPIPDYSAGLIRAPLGFKTQILNIGAVNVVN